MVAKTKILKMIHIVNTQSAYPLLCKNPRKLFSSLTSGKEQKVGEKELVLQVAVSFFLSPPNVLKYLSHDQLLLFHSYSIHGLHFLSWIKMCY